MALARQHAAELAVPVGLSTRALQALTTAVSEIAQDIVDHGRGGELTFAALEDGDLQLSVTDSGNELPALQSLAMVAAGYGLPARKLGTVSLIGPVRMDYAGAIRTVREAALQLSRFIEDVYEG